MSLINVASSTSANCDVVFFHHAGGSSYAYANLARQLDIKANVYCFELAGRGTRMFDDFNSEASSVLREACDAIMSAKLGVKRRLFLFGHSLGAELVYQLAILLQADLDNVEVCLSARKLTSMLNDQEESRAKLSDEEILAMLRDYGETPMEFLEDREMKKHVLDTMRNDFSLLDELSSFEKVKFEGAMNVLGGLTDPYVSSDELALWQWVSEKPINKQMFDGDHFYLFNSPEFVTWLENRISSS